MLNEFSVLIDEFSREKPIFFHAFHENRVAFPQIKS